MSQFITNLWGKDEIKTNRESAALIEKSLPTETELAELKFFVKLIIKARCFYDIHYPVSKSIKISNEINIPRN